jgi:hypothetical protein
MFRDKLNIHVIMLPEKIIEYYEQTPRTVHTYNSYEKTTELHKNIAF